MRPAGPHEIDLVVVKKQRPANKYKRTLHYASTDLRWQQEGPMRLSKDLARDTVDNCHVEIIGYILGVLRANHSPR